MPEQRKILNDQNINDIDLLVVVFDNVKVREICACLQRDIRRGGIAIDLLVLAESDLAERAADP